MKATRVIKYSEKYNYGNPAANQRLVYLQMQETQRPINESFIVKRILTTDKRLGPEFNRQFAVVEIESSREK